MTQISYAVVYAEDGTFLLAWKPYLGYFFGNGKTGEVVPAGRELDGKVNYAFPGSARSSPETVTAAARRAFQEQTGQPMPATVATTEHEFAASYAAAYFCLADGTAVRDCSDACNTVSLAHSVPITSAIISGKVKRYQDIAGYAAAHALVPWAYDNQLQETWSRNLLDAETWNWIQTWQSPLSGLEHAFAVMRYLRETILAAKPTTSAARARPRLGAGLRAAST